MTGIKLREDKTQKSLMKSQMMVTNAKFRFRFCKRFVTSVQISEIKAQKSCRRSQKPQTPEIVTNAWLRRVCNKKYVKTKKQGPMRRNITQLHRAYIILTI